MIIIIIFLQNLIFLVRDWYNKYQYAYGLLGGYDYLMEVLKVRAAVLNHIVIC